MLLCDRNGSLDLVGPFSTFCLGDLAARPIGSGVFAKYSTYSLASVYLYVTKSIKSRRWALTQGRSIQSAPPRCSDPLPKGEAELERNQQFAGVLDGRNIVREPGGRARKWISGFRSTYSFVSDGGSQ